MGFHQRSGSIDLTIAATSTNLTVSLNGQAGHSYQLLRSLDLQAWPSVATNSAVADGPVTFVQPLLTSKAFFRVLVQ